MIDQRPVHGIGTFSIFLVFLAFIPSSSPATICQSPPSLPIALPVSNVTLADNVISRGVPISIGSPPQLLAFKPNGGWNNTYCFGASSPDCPVSQSTNACAGGRGGSFNEGASTTFSKVAVGENPEIAREGASQHNNDTFGTDTLAVNSTLSLKEFDLGVNTGVIDSFNMLGLGHNSTLLDSLLASKAVSSRTYSYWEGWSGADAQHQMDGVMTFGGYDEAKISGQNITIPITSIDPDTCRTGYIVTITDVKVTVNGSPKSLFGGSLATAFRSCIDEGFAVSSIPSDIWESFVDATGVTETGHRSTGFNFWGTLIEAAGAYEGDLTISISPGLDIVIPNHQLIVPNYSYSPQGEKIQINSSTTREVLLNGLYGVNKDGMPLLARSFLTSAYLLVDHDKQVFTLAKAKATTDQNLVAIAPATCKEVDATSTAISTAVSTTSSATSQPTETASSPGDRKGVIAGAAVGGTSAIALCILGMVLFLRRRRQARQLTLSSIEKPKRDSTSDTGYNFGGYKPEMPSDHEHQPRAELPLERNPSYQLAPYEMADQRHSSGPLARVEMADRSHPSCPLARVEMADQRHSSGPLARFEMSTSSK